MTNTPSGSKRSWEGSSVGSSESRDNKRQREEYHRSSKHSSGRHHRDDDGRRNNEHGRRRDSDRRDHGRHRHRSGSRSRSHRERSRSRSKGHSRKNSPPSPPPPRKVDEEREEGEISPPPAPVVADVNTSAQPQTVPPPLEAEPLADMELDIPPSPPSIEETLAARRAAREAIMAKYAAVASVEPTPSPIPAGDISSAVQPPTLSAHSNGFINTPSDSVATPTATDNAASCPRASRSPSPAAEFTLAKDDEDTSQSQVPRTQGNQVSAADYDPSLDRREDEHKRVNAPNEVVVVEEEEEEEEEEDDDLDDMFADVDAKPKKTKVKKKKVQKPAAPALVTTTLDSAADAEGYYSVILGEQLDGGRYQVFSSLGKGMFANVVRARVLQPDPGEPSNKEVAIKIVRCQESMYKAGLKEVQMLNKLIQADPEDKKHIVRLERTFEHRGHLCLVFESLSMNLRDVVKRFGKDVGLNIKAVRAYAHQLFLALSLLKKLGVMHADIKPDNILVNEHKTHIKLCDLGSASDASENDITPYLVSRFYRAPEIILGHPYDPSLDIWSIGCTLYELYTGKILFPGRSNNQMLLLMMELKGRFNGKMIKKAKFGDDYFDEMGGFDSIEKDGLGVDVVRKVHIQKPSRDLRARLMPSNSVKMKEDERKLVISFIDLLDKCLALDPARRISPREALSHPFIRG